MMRRIAMLLLISGTAACGDIGNVRINVGFPNEETELRTRALQLVVRAVPKDHKGCDDLWRDQPTGLAEIRSIIEYPNRVDLVGAPVKLSEYEALTFLIYAHPSRDITASTPIAGGCVESPIDAASTQAIDIQMQPRPGG